METNAPRSTTEPIFNKLEAENAALKAALFQAQEAAKDLCEQLTAAQKDAERYRWIRRCVPFSTLKSITKKYLHNYKNDEVDAQLDAAIDAAMEAKP